MALLRFLPILAASLLLASCGTFRDIAGMFDDDAQDDADLGNRLTKVSESGGGSGGGSTTTGTGSLCIWTGDYYLDLPVTVYVDGVARGTVTRWYSYPPNAGSTGTVTISISAGYHTIYARGSGGAYVSPDSWYVTRGQTTWYELFAY